MSRDIATMNVSRLASIGIAAMEVDARRRDLVEAKRARNKGEAGLNVTQLEENVRRAERARTKALRVYHAEVREYRDWLAKTNRERGM